MNSLILIISLLATSGRLSNQDTSWCASAKSWTRDKLIHHYFGVKWEIVWDVVKNEIPGIKLQVELN